MEMSSEAGSVSESLLPKTEVKDDPDTSLTTTAITASVSSPIKVKKEEQDDETIDRSLPEAEDGNDMFGDVNDPEYVDLTYEGIAEVDGVNCFVCEGLSLHLVYEKSSAKNVPEFKIRQIPKPVIITRPLYQLFGMSSLTASKWLQS